MINLFSKLQVPAHFTQDSGSEKTREPTHLRRINAGLIIIGIMFSFLQGCASQKMKQHPIGKAQPEYRERGMSVQELAKESTPSIVPVPLPEAGKSPQPSPSPSDQPSPQPSVLPSPSLQGLAGPALREVTLVIGSGDAYSLSAVGVLQVLTDERIPVGALSGTGVGALVAAIYSLHPRVGKLEWEIEKLITPLWEQKDGGWMAKLRSALPRLDSRAEVITKELSRIFRDRQFSQLQLKLQVLVEDKTRKESSVMQEGSVGKAVQVALADGGRFPFVREGGRTLGRSDLIGYSVSDAKVFNRGPILVLDTRDPESNRQGSPVVERELSLATWVVKPDFSGIRSTDFERRSEIYLRGREAMKLKIAEIRRALAEEGGRQ